MNSFPRIAFFGTYKFSGRYLGALAGAGFEIEPKVTDKNQGFAAIKEKLAAAKPDLGVIAYYGRIIPKEILEIPKNGFLNVHPSLLPRWRGPSPVQYAILAGDEKIGVTVHLAAEKFDAGPILTQKELEVLGSENCFELEAKLADLGAGLLVETIPKWLENKITPRPQDESKATYSQMIKTEDGKIDWTHSSVQIRRQVRALTPEPGTFTFLPAEAGLDKKRLIILDSQVIGREGRGRDFEPGKIIKYNNSFIIAAKDGFIKPLKIKLEGRKETTPEAFLRGYPKIIGLFLT